MDIESGKPPTRLLSHKKMTTLSELESKVFRVIAEKVASIIPDLQSDMISIEKKMEDYGCNSIDRTDIVWMVQEELGLDIPVSEFYEVSNIRTLTNLLVRHLESH